MKNTGKTTIGRTYLVSDQALAFGHDIEVELPFKGGDTYRGPLGGLPAWLRAHPRADVPVRCLCDGRRHGFRFVLTAKTERGATGLSVLVGHEVMPFDGWTYASRSACRDHYDALKRAGIFIDGSWLSVAVTELPYDEPKANSPKPAQPELPLETTEEVNAMIFG